MKKMLFHITMLLAIQLCFQSALAQMSIPTDTTYNIMRVYRQIKKEYPYAMPVKDSLPAGIKRYDNNIYLELEHPTFGTRQLHLDVFRPDHKKKLPAIVLIHGGGWRSGTKDMQVPMAQMLATKGYVAVPVEYQLSLEAQYPAAVHNIKESIRWIKANAERFHIDTTKIAISGCSAGGQLASLVGLTNGLSRFEMPETGRGVSSEVHAIVNFDGVIDFMAPSSLNLERKPDAADISWLGGSFESHPALWKEASPIFWADEKRIVPMLFFNSGFPRFHAGQDELLGMLKRWNVYHQVHEVDVKVHPFWLFHPWIDGCVNTIDAFLSAIFMTDHNR
ncbi:alpha/beta hydrolase [Sphingobacterium olei]|uniref:Alpha/beta hydrolase n=1 Tax=Sphingobacterium olei TaxID=2571155 RepID=A0A4U0P1A5_9SPHI|nr:alpha/beta hydrolase [Sphingobacterium olei]TJZ61036.1 alpha/beta hydrolase [Sphingobacterium olei]